MKVLRELQYDLDHWDRAVYIVVDGYDEFRIVRLNPLSSVFIEENEDAYIRG